MSGYNGNVKEEILNYIDSFSTNDPFLENLEQIYNNRTDIRPSIGKHTGIFLTWLIKLISAERILDIGSCIGYSAIVMGKAVQHREGSIITIEYDKSIYEEAKENINAAKLRDTVEIINGDANSIVDDIDGKFDLILQDSDKCLYLEMLDKCIDKLRPGGVLVADDTLFKPMGIPEKFSRPVDEYNRVVFNDSRLTSTMLPFGDGITMSIKK